MEKKAYHNVLPSKYSSWTQFFLMLDLPRVIMQLSASRGKNIIKFEKSTFPPGSQWLDGTLTVDIEFLKARIFDDILKNSLITRQACSKLVVSYQQATDMSDYTDAQNALHEIRLWAEVISQSREKPGRIIDLLTA